MDLAANCKDKLAYFRIKELKDVLTQLGLSKQGKKQDLVDRILAILSDDQVSGMWAKKNAVRKEEVAKLVDDTYRKMQVSGATNDLASKGQGVSDSSNIKFKEEPELELSHKMDKVRCLCGSSLQADSMIKCEDSRCNVWQHIGCVLIPDKVTEGVIPAPPDVFYCELCRLNRADPFLVTMAHSLYPVKLSIANRPTDGTNPVQSIEKTFQLTRADKDLLAKPEYDVQAWCMLLNDKVSFRLQWPQYADLQVNGVPVRAINRPGSQLLGANGRDDGPVITPCTRDGMNKISLTGCDARVFCLGVRIIKRRTVQQILNLIPKESDGEIFEDALARVCRCVGGGAATENADSDSDLEVVADSIPVSLRCPMSGSRMKVAGRFKPCVHMGCFDLDVFVEMNQRSRKWQCPICLKNYSLENVIIDPYFNRITSKMRSCGEDVTEIEVKPDGSWRVKAENDRRVLGDLTQWHLPNGTLCVRTDGEAISKADTVKQVKQECFSEGHTGLKLGIKKNGNGVWEVSKPGDYSGNRPRENHEHRLRNGIPINSSATGSGRDGDDPSVNQDGGVNIDSVSPNIETVYNFPDPVPSAPGGDAEVIVLSDSDEDNELLISSGPAYRSNESNAGRVSYEVTLPEISTTYPEDPSLGAGGSSCLGLFGSNGEEFGPPLWSLASSSQGGPGFQFFGSDADPLVDMQHGSLNCPPSINGYNLPGETALGPTTLVPSSSGHLSTADINDGMADNPIAFDGEDPSLQLFLPTRPSDAAIQNNVRDQPDVSNNICLEDWTSLTLGGCGSGGHEEPGGVNEINPRQQQLPFEESALDSLADTASLLLGMNDNRSNNHSVNGNGPSKTNRERSQSPFLFPRKRRSVRPRLYLSIDSDSE